MLTSNWNKACQKYRCRKEIAVFSWVLSCLLNLWTFQLFEYEYSTLSIRIKGKDQHHSCMKRRFFYDICAKIQYSNSRHGFYSLTMCAFFWLWDKTHLLLWMFGRKKMKFPITFEECEFHVTTFTVFLIFKWWTYVKVNRFRDYFASSYFFFATCNHNLWFQWINLTLISEIINIVKVNLTF